MTVTVSPGARARPGAGRAGLAAAGTALAERFAGFLGAGWLRPAPGSDTWHVLYRFADETALVAWERSRPSGLVAGARRGRRRGGGHARRTGVEGWFDAAAPVAAGRPRRRAGSRP